MPTIPPDQLANGEQLKNVTAGLYADLLQDPTRIFGRVVLLEMMRATHVLLQQLDQQGVKLREIDLRDATPPPK